MVTSPNVILDVSSQSTLAFIGNRTCDGPIIIPWGYVLACLACGITFQLGVLAVRRPPRFTRAVMVFVFAVVPLSWCVLIFLGWHFGWAMRSAGSFGKNIGSEALSLALEFVGPKGIILVASVVIAVSVWLVVLLRSARRLKDATNK